MEGDMTWGANTVQYTDDGLQNCTPETYIILLTNVTLISLMKIILKERNMCQIYVSGFIHEPRKT